MLKALSNKVTTLLRDREYREACVAFGRPLGPRGNRPWWMLIAVCMAIVVWQHSFAGPRARLDDSYKMTAASGVHEEKSFVYFLYYLNIFPVVSTKAMTCKSATDEGCRDLAGTPGDYSYEGALAVLDKEGATLQQDYGWTWYAGDRGKIYLYMFDAWLKGAPWDPSPRPAERLFFTGSLCALFAASWWVRRPLLGVCLVMLLGSNPFQLYEVNGHDNVFGLTITTAILLLAIHMPLLQRWYRPHPRWIFLWPLGVGILMATIRTVRSEPMALLIAPAATYLFLRGLTLRRRLALVGVFALSFWLDGAVWNAHFLRQQERAAEVVASHGGHPFPEEIRLYHHFWHPIWCGLGDFDKDHGYKWDDHAAASYARPILRAQGIYVPSGYPNYRSLDPREYFDPETKIYKRLPYEQPHYNDVIRDKVLEDIRSDPGWYVDILLKRLKHIFTKTTPVRITSPAGWVTVPWHPALLLPTVFLLAFTRSRFHFRVVLFTLPSVATALLVYSDKGMTYYGVFHVVSCAVVLVISLEHAAAAIRRAVHKRRTRAVASSDEVAGE